jgi:hypothetical protein
MLAAAVAPALCFVAAGRSQECGAAGKNERVPVVGVTLAREGREEREPRLKEPEGRSDMKRLQMRAGDQITIVAIVRPPDATDKDVLWTSSNPAVVAVEDGAVTAKAPGYAVITATSADGRRTDDYGISVFSWNRKAKGRRGKPPVYRMPEPFEPSEMLPCMGGGTAAIAGRAAIAFAPGARYLDGPVVMPAASVTVFPAMDRYLTDYVEYTLRGYRIEPPVPKEAEALVRTVPCGAAGNFAVAGLPAGRYRVYGSDPEWGWASLGVVALEDGETKAVAVSN